MRKYRLRNRFATSGEAYLAILYATIFMLFLIFGLSLHLPYISLPFKISSALADSGVIVCACMFLKGKWRFIGVAIAFAIGCLLLANLLYFRNFDDIIQASSYLHADVGDPTITAGAMSSFRLSDILFLILPLFPLAVLVRERHKVLESPVRPVWKTCMASLCLLSWSISYVGVFRRLSIWNPDDSLKEVAETIFSEDSVTWCNAYEMHNFTGYAVKCIVSCCKIGIDLTAEDIEAIKSHIEDRAGCNVKYIPDSIMPLKDRNLIMIIVESLPFKVFEKPEVSELIPTLMQAVEDSLTIVSKCSVLADYGRSSDAQFIYNTGLLPLRHEALVDNYAFNDYPSLAKALKRPSMEIIGESKRLWLHSLTTKSYGFDTLIDNIAPKGMDQDSIIFDRAAREISSMKSPFLLFITTISMHDPYDERKVSSEGIKPIKATDERDREYYARLNHFDKSLARFLSDLKLKGIYDDSVIVILGDHEIRESKISKNLHDDSVPFIVINSHLKSENGILTTQLDVFPSILDMLGYSYRYLGVQYTGLGQSIFFDDASKKARYYPTDEDYEISEMIIKGRPTL